MEERIALLLEFSTGVFAATELCARHGISRTTFYEWKARRDRSEARWFEDRSHATKGCPYRTPEAIAARMVRFKECHRQLGPKKVRARLAGDHPDVAWSAVSTVGDILKRADFVTPVRRRRRPVEQGEIVAPSTEPNAEWSIDFKG